MVDFAKSVLDRSGIVNRETFFKKVPDPPYAVYAESIDTSESADCTNNLLIHYINIELYESDPRHQARAALEQTLNAANIEWTRSETVWLEDEQSYMTEYDFTFYEKGEILNA